VTDILDELHWRGLIALTTDEQALRRALAAGPVTLYGGFDPTASSLHVGNLVLILALRRFQRAGHRPLGLVGGATGLIGDPSGKSAERVLNAREVVAAWVERFRAQIEPLLDVDGPYAARMVDNLEWTAQLPAIDFLRDIGKHFPVNRMLGRESVAGRLEAGGISYTEFSYQILQAMDFLELYRRYGCTLQLGGSDQWGNLTAGVDLIRRVTGKHVHALATPLITKADGTKYGKTESDAVWLDPEMTTPYAFYQFWINQPDTEVGKLLKVFSFRGQEEIEALEKEAAERPAARSAQRALAADLTALVHGEAELARVEAASKALFGQGDLRALDERTLSAALAEVPSAEVPLAGGVLPPVSDLLAAAGLVPSKSAGRRTVAEGGAYVNNRKVAADETIGASDVLPGQWVVLRRGKRNVGAVRAVAEARVR
jgi:tyrosyl-tRNA synthetase